jgi:hypothetical protein
MISALFLIIVVVVVVVRDCEVCENHGYISYEIYRIHPVSVTSTGDCRIMDQMY